MAGTKRDGTKRDGTKRDGEVKIYYHAKFGTPNLKSGRFTAFFVKCQIRDRGGEEGEGQTAVLLFRYTRNKLKRKLKEID